VKRFLVLCVAPVLLLLAVRIVPLVAGERTLLLRDTLVTHLGLRATLAAALAEGDLPLVDPLRAGGQPLVGNPNVVALYPDNLLLLVASSLWQLNAHFWLHWLLALAAATWLGRAVGLGREAAFGVGVAYAFSGFFVSQLNLYNGVAGVAWAPALAAALCELASPEKRRRATLALGLVWTLSILAGDPILAALALVAGLALALPRAGRVYPYGLAAAALAAGSLIAAPQLVATWQVLAESYRGFHGFSPRDLAVAAPHASAWIDLLVPLFFGRPDRGAFWGNAYFGGFPPLYFSLAPGAVALALGLAGITARRAPRGRALLLTLAGLALAFSAGTPLVALLAQLPGMGLVRFVAKFALWGALGWALLAGLGIETARADERGARRLRLGLAALGLVYALLLLLFTGAPERLVVAFRARWGVGLSDAAWAHERTRWAAIAMLCLAALAVSWLAATRRGATFGLREPALLAAQAALQLGVLAGILPTDESRFYRAPPELLARLPNGAVLAHGAVNGIFGQNLMQPAGDSPDLATQVRRAWASGFSFAGHAAGRRYELDFAPEGLDHFSAYALGDACEMLDDAARVRLLAATGVDRLLLPRPLAGVAESAARPVARFDDLAPPLHVYEIVGALPEVVVAGRVTNAPHLNAALARLLAPDFDPRGEAVLPGDEAPQEGVAGGARLVAATAESLELEVESPSGGVLIVRRAFLPIWRATIDGRPARPQPAQMTRLGLALPPGARQVRLWVDRRPFRLACAAALVGLVALVLVARRAGGSIRASSQATPP